MIERLRSRAREFKLDTYALYLAARHSGTPLVPKVLALVVAGYALSPIDLIPDFIPVLGYLDDLLLVPAGIALCVRLVPEDVMEECRAKAAMALGQGQPTGRVATGVVIVISFGVAALILYPLAVDLLSR